MFYIKRGLAVLVTLLATSCINKNYYEPFSYAHNIEYKYDRADYWQTPNKTRKLKTGDCEDKVILLLDEWKKRGIEGRLVIGFLYWYDFGSCFWDKEAHAWCEVEYKGKLYIADPTNDMFFRKSKKFSHIIYEELGYNSYIEGKKRRLERDMKKD